MIGENAEHELPDLAKFHASIAFYRNDPVAFVERIIKPGAPIQKWQRAVMRAVLKNKKTAVASCQGAGKTAVAAWIILWFLVCHEHANVICTAPGMTLLQKVLWKELYKWITHSSVLTQILEWSATEVKHKGKDKNGMDLAPNWFAVARTTTAHYGEDGVTKQAEGLAGFHSKHLLFIVDEASGVASEHCATAENTLTGGPGNKILYLGNPLRTDGRFYEVFNDDIICQQWKLFNISALPNGVYQGPDGAEELRNITWVSEIAEREEAENAIRARGINHLEVVTRKLGRFPTESTVDTGFTVAEIEQAQRRSYICKAGDSVQIGVDCARFGDDEMVIIVRRGWKITNTIVRAQSSAPVITGLIVETLREEAGETLRLEGIAESEWDRVPWNGGETLRQKKMQEIIVCIDEAGEGGGSGVCDSLWAAGYGNVMGVRFGDDAVEFEKYANLASEMWLGRLKEMIPHLDMSESLVADIKAVDARGKPRRGPDQKLRRQLTTRKYKYTGKLDQKRLEPKDEMKRRRLPSPDRADALCLACVIPPLPGVAYAA